MPQIARAIAAHSSELIERLGLVLAEELRRRLTKGFHPVWSPDGAGLAFQRNDSIFTIRINGTAERLVAENVGVGYQSWGR